MCATWRQSYPWLCIKKEPFHIFATRRMVKDGSEYFGPYTSFKTVSTILELIKELPLRTCNYDLSKSNIDSGKFKVSRIPYWNCMGPCEGHETIENYKSKSMRFAKFWKEISKKAWRILSVSWRIWHWTCILKKLKKSKKIEILENYQSRSTIVNENYQYVFDSFWWKCSLCQLLANFPVPSFDPHYGNQKKIDETDEELLELAIIELRERFQLPVR
jgi:excinuclease ABC subunit C